MLKKPELLDLSCFLPHSALGRGVVSIFHGNSRIHDCTFQRRELLPPLGLGTDELLSRLGIHCLVPSGTFQSRQPFSPRTVVKPKRRMQALPRRHGAGSRLSRTSRCCRRLGGVARLQLPQRQGGRGDPGTATPGAASPLLRGLGAPGDWRVGTSAGSGSLQGFG